MHHSISHLWRQVLEYFDIVEAGCYVDKRDRQTRVEQEFERDL